MHSAIARFLVALLLLAASDADARDLSALMGAATKTASSGGGGGAFSTWNPSDNSDLTLTNSNNTASAATTNAWHSVRGTASQTGSAKVYFEVSVGAIDPTGGWMFGIGTSGVSLTNYAGAGANNYGFQCFPSPAHSETYYNGSNIGQDLFRSCAPSDVIGVAVDVSAKKVWIANITQGGVWNVGSGGTQDPASGMGGISITNITAPYFILFSGNFNGGVDTATLNTGGSAFTGTTPSGFSAWH